MLLTIMHLRLHIVHADKVIYLLLLLITVQCINLLGNSQEYNCVNIYIFKFWFVSSHLKGTELRSFPKMCCSFLNQCKERKL